MTEKFTTGKDARNAIIATLGDVAADFDIDAIFDEAFAFDDGYDEKTGITHLNCQGFYQSVEADEFWTIVEKHAVN